MAMSEFQKAFREARNSGEKTFSFNGKKYNTKLSSDVEQKSVGNTPSPGVYVPRDSYTAGGHDKVDKQNEEMRQEASMAAYKPRRTPKALSETIRPGTNVNYENEDATSETFKKGGNVKMPAKRIEMSAPKASSASKRADGIAQRGKTRGAMIMCGGGKVKK